MKIKINSGFTVHPIECTFDDLHPKHQNDIVTQSDLEEMTELFLKLDFNKREEIINTLK